MIAVLSRACRSRTARRGLLALGVLGLLGLLAAPAYAGDVYSNIGPAPQVPAGGIFGRYPIANYQLDQFFPAISVGLISGVDVSGVVPMIAFFFAQVLWMITAFLANGVITLFAFAFSLDLVNGNGSPGSGALTPIATAIHNLYSSTLGAPWLIAAVVAAGLWAMWKALVQRRYSETAGALAVSLLYCVLAVGIVAQPERTIGPASKLSNELSTALLSLTTQGSVTGEQQAKSAASDQLFRTLVVDPWTVLEFGGIEHCTTGGGEDLKSAAVRPLSSDPSRDARLAGELELQTEVAGEGKRCINNRNKYAPHFLAYPFGSKDRGDEHEALEHGSSGDLPSSDPAKSGGSYPLGKADEPAAEAMGKGGQYQRLLLSIVILAGEAGAFALLGALALGVILAQILLLTLLCLAPVALILAVFPGRGHDFFRSWVAKLAGYLTRKVVYSLILAIVLAVCQALDNATSNLGWLLAFVLQAAFLWTVFLQRKKLTSDLLAASAGQRAANDGTGLRDLYFAAGIRALTKAGRSGGSTGGTPERDSVSASAPAPHDSGPEVAVPHATGVGAARLPSDEYDEPIADSEGADVGAALNASSAVSAAGTGTSEREYGSGGSAGPGVGPSAGLSPADMHSDPIADSEGVPPVGEVRGATSAGAPGPPRCTDEHFPDGRGGSGAILIGESEPAETHDDPIADSEGATLRGAQQGRSGAPGEQPATSEEGQ
jgi:hypothetical protein